MGGGGRGVRRRAHRSDNSYVDPVMNVSHAESENDGFAPSNVFEIKYLTETKRTDVCCLCTVAVISTRPHEMHGKRPNSAGSERERADERIPSNRPIYPLGLLRGV